MASYKLRGADLEYVKAAASMYAHLDTGVRSYMPIETIPRSHVSKWYTLEEIPGPALSITGGDYMGVRTARLEGENPLVFMRYKFHWDITEVEAAQRAGVPLKADDASIALRHINDKIGQMVIEGLDWPEPISGATEVGTDLGATLDATMVATADSFITHASTAYNHMITNGFRGPYNWLVCKQQAQYLGLPLGAGGGQSQGNYINDTFGFTTYIENAELDTTFAANVEVGLEDVIPTMIYNTDDGIWVLLAASPENMALQEVGPPQVFVNPEINRDTNKYEGFVEWHGTVRFTHAASVGFMEDVDNA